VGRFTWWEKRIRIKDMTEEGVCTSSYNGKLLSFASFIAIREKPSGG
jgi:hypothetical protein